MDSDNAQNEGCKPHNHGEEREGLSSAPLTTVVATAKGDSCPIPGTSTVGTVEIANEEAKDSGPSSSKDQIGYITSHTRAGGDRPNDGEDDGKRSPDHTKNNASERPDTMSSTLVEEVGCQTEDNGSKHELCNAKDERYKA